MQKTKQFFVLAGVHSSAIVEMIHDGFITIQAVAGAMLFKYVLSFQLNSSA